MTKALLYGTLALALGTFAFRFAGPVLRSRVKVSPRAIKLLEISSVVLLTALVVTTLVPSGGADFGFALPAGVLVAAVLAWRRAPILVVLIAAAVVTAGLRLLGVH
ncbi:AzlD domain-containing protein [Nocardia huaxiensis]|uniref:AzlD domain-containing protein n=1 Tax=Nocardia huaxiensis TaxID=2755382 RepID=A0A7D6V8N9_9NOCA|nr:AzlD domain-containing protein [Nocardia huaxiensis]QLY30301.1 AzlD domain-containing protein [Nocardia huaxiensis]UFS96067.1 AzlD domain-containing protein [Nocardia huaxiensis]